MLTRLRESDRKTKGRDSTVLFRELRHLKRYCERPFPKQCANSPHRKADCQIQRWLEEPVDDIPWAKLLIRARVSHGPRMTRRVFARTVTATSDRYTYATRRGAKTYLFFRQEWIVSKRWRDSRFWDLSKLTASRSLRRKEIQSDEIKVPARL